MKRVTQNSLDLMPEGAKVVFFEQDEHRLHMKAYPIIKEFDGVICDFKFPEGGGYFTCIPISSIEYNTRKAVTLTIMEDLVEYKITDDNGDVRFIYIRSEESGIIFKSILAYKSKYGIIPTLK